jgi:hypothetical protein
MILFTDFVPDDSVTHSGKHFKTQVGWSLIACIAANSAFSVGLILREIVLNVIKAFKTRRAKVARLK